MQNNIHIAKLLKEAAKILTEEDDDTLDTNEVDVNEAEQQADQDIDDTIPDFEGEAEQEKKNDTIKNLPMKDLMQLLLRLLQEIENGNKDLLLKVIQSSVAIKKLDLYGNTVLHFLAFYGIKDIMSIGAASSVRNIGGKTPEKILNDIGII